MNLRAVKKEGLPYNDLWDLFKMVSYSRSYVVPSGLYCIAVRNIVKKLKHGCDDFVKSSYHI